MAKLNLGAEGKQIFIDCYNNHEIAYKDLNKEITRLLQEKNIVEDGVKLTAELVRNIFENKFEMPYRNRPKGPRAQAEKLEVYFDEEELDVNVPTDQENTVLQEEEAVEETVTAEVEQEEDDWNVNQTETRQEPTNFQF